MRVVSRPVWKRQLFCETCLMILEVEAGDLRYGKIPDLVPRAGFDVEGLYYHIICPGCSDIRPMNGLLPLDAANEARMRAGHAPIPVPENETILPAEAGEGRASEIHGEGSPDALGAREGAS